MKILWLDLNCSYAHSSLALPALHAQISENSEIEWDMVSCTINENINMIVGAVTNKKPDIIAATCWLFTHEALIHILARCKAILPECSIMLGGPEFLGENSSFLSNYKFVDCVLRGEGEEVFPQLLEVWKQKNKWHTIKGLCYFDSNNIYHDNGTARVIEFDKLKSPESSSLFNWSKPFVQLETTRGCFNTCAFCVSGGEKPVRTISVDTIRERIRTIHSHGIKNIRVLDRTFNYNVKRAKELLAVFREFSPDICFHLEIHPALLADEIKEELKSLPAGLLHLEAGIQSLHENVLQTSKRHGSLSQSLEGLKFLCSLSNMETHADLIAGLPLYTLKQIFEDVVELARYGTGEIQLESLKLLPGTEMRKRAKELGICYSPMPPYEVLKTNEISIEELKTAMHLSRMLDGYYNTEAWQSITRELIINEPEFIYAFLNHLESINVIEQPLSLEKRGIILYEFCKRHYPSYITQTSIAWIEAGMSLKKQPAENVLTKRQTPPTEWNIEYGEFKSNMRLCFLPDMSSNNNEGYWFGYSSDTQNPKPVFKAIGKAI